MLVGIHGIESGENHGLDFFEAGQGLKGGSGLVRNRVADFRVSHILAVRHQKPDLTRSQFIHLYRLGSQNTEGFHFQHASIPHQANFLSFAERAFKDPRQHNDPAIRIEPGIEDERLQPILRVAFRWRHSLHDGFQDIRHSVASLGTDQHRVRSIETDRALDHLFGPRNIGAGQVDFVDHRNDFEAVVDR